jgi:hypothetical protein
MPKPPFIPARQFQNILHFRPAYQAFSGNIQLYLHTLGQFPKLFNRFFCPFNFIYGFL